MPTSKSVDLAANGVARISSDIISTFYCFNNAANNCDFNQI